MRSWTEKGKVVFFFSHFSLGWSEIWVLTEYGTCKSVDLCISCHSGKQWRRWEVGAEEEGSESLSGTGKWNFIFIASINNRNFKLWLCKTAKKKMSKLHIINATLHCGDVCQFLRDMYRYILCVDKNMITIVVIFILCPPPLADSESLPSPRLQPVVCGNWIQFRNHGRKREQFHTIKTNGKREENAKYSCAPRLGREQWEPSWQIKLFFSQPHSHSLNPKLTILNTSHNQTRRRWEIFSPLVAIIFN